MEVRGRSGGIRRPVMQERIIIALLAVLAMGAWIVTIQQARANSMGMGATMGMSGPLFLGVWVVMMVAMMFPSAAPMIVLFSRLAHARRGRGQAFVPTWVFVIGYLAVWAASGIAFYAAAVTIQSLAGDSGWIAENGARITGVLFVAAGAYQLSPFKSACLSKCRSPFDFILKSWRDGYGGAIQMGVQHGLFCLGCCWLLFAILFPLGIMSVPAMAVLAVLILGEKTLPQGMLLARGLGIALFAYGLGIIVAPHLLVHA